MTDSTIDADEAVAQGAAVIAARYGRLQAIEAAPNAAVARSFKDQPPTTAAWDKQQHNEVSGFAVMFSNLPLAGG